MRVSGWAVLVRVLIALALGGGLLWWAILLWGAEHHWLFAALQYAPVWGWLLPVGAVNVLALTQPWRWRLVALAALLVVLGPVMGLPRRRLSNLVPHRLPTHRKATARQLRGRPLPPRSRRSRLRTGC